ncbi:MAG TPA: DUF499 domain-containing protein [Blastocatellia bacterium]|nr:DUF499 domain-containing protein [Blastocatellia bacterium]
MASKNIKRVWEICEPHGDVFAKDLDPSLFAVSLHHVEQGTADRDYTDPERFFVKTFMTRSLANLMERVLGRLCAAGGVGAPILRLETPFGGGKTHTMAALYHLCKHPDASGEAEAVRPILERLNLRTIPPGIRVAVLDCRELDARNGREVEGRKILTLWGELAFRLGGKAFYERMRDSDEARTAPGAGKLSALLNESQPALILMDELLDYLVKAKAVKVGDSNLMEQTGVFLQELTAAVSASPQAVLVVSLPASSLEIPEENQEAAERLFQYAKKVLGRVELVETPVAQDEIFGVLQRRLFKWLGEEREIKRVVNAMADYYNEYARFFPDRVRTSDYRGRMLKAYPFHPELIGLLYERWGPHPQFQRTRGALRLLAMVIRRLWNQRPGSAFLIQPHHTDLADRHIRAEVVKLLDSGFDAVVTGDVLQRADEIDRDLGQEYRREKLAQGAASCAFLFSISAATRDMGATEEEIRTALLRPDINPAQISEVLSHLRERLWYLVYRDKRYRFQAKPNLNKIILDYESDITEEQVQEGLKNELEKIAGKGKTPLTVIVAPLDHRGVPDRAEPTLVVLPLELHERSRAEAWMKEVTQQAGEAYRSHKNMLVFLVPEAGNLSQLRARMRRVLALEAIRNSGSFRQMDEEDRQQMDAQCKDASTGLQGLLLTAYSRIYRPSPEGISELPAGPIPEGVKAKTLAEAVYARLEKEGLLLKEVSPEYLSEKILAKDREISLDQVASAFVGTPGAPLLTEPKQAISRAVEEGVKQARFGVKVGGRVYFGELVPAGVLLEDRVTIVSKEHIGLEKVEPAGEGQRPVVSGLRLQTSTSHFYPVQKVVDLLRNASAQVNVELREPTGELAKKKAEIEKLLRDYGISFEWEEEKLS